MIHGLMYFLSVHPSINCVKLLIPLQGHAASCIPAWIGRKARKHQIITIISHKHTPTFTPMAK